MTLQRAAKTQSLKKKILVTVVSNITLEPYFQLLINRYFSELQIFVEVSNIDYFELLSGNISIAIAHSDYIIVIPNFDNLYPHLFYKYVLSLSESAELIDNEIARMKRACSVLHAKTNASVIWFGYEDYCYEYSSIGTVPLINYLVDELNMLFSRTKESNTIFVDFKRIIASVGIDKAYDNKQKCRWNSPYSQDLIDNICAEIYKHHLILKGVTKKCIVLDCDNVLWGGILSEDGIEKIELGSNGSGRSYQDFQKYLVFLYNHGVILTICSKNDVSDVMRVFHEHTEMILKEEHVACFQVNWDNKAENIQKIADTLNIGLDSIVFIDDSDFELLSVKKMLPDVTVIKYERDTIYNNLSCFNLNSNTDITEIYRRNATYKTNELRQKLMSTSKSFDEYMSMLNVQIDIHRALPNEYTRIAELTQRTNKCTNGTRYTFSEVKNRTESPYVYMYSVSAKDCFSDLGIVGAVEIEKNRLTLFSLSCRALGRRIEDAMLKFIANNHEITSMDFVSTKKNDSVKSILSKIFSSDLLDIDETNMSQTDNI